VGSKGPDITQTALDALAKRASKDSVSSINANMAAPVPNSATGAATAGNTAVDATAGGSTAAAIADILGGKKEKSTSTSSDAAQAAAPPVDPSANQAVPVVPQPVAVVVSTPVIPVAPVASASASGASGTGPDATQIAAASDAVAGALRGKADRAAAEAAKSGGAAAGTPAAGTPPKETSTTTAGAKAADAARSTPSLAPQSPPKEMIPPGGPVQPNAADGAQVRNADGVPTKAAAADQTRQRAATGQPTDGAVGQQGNSNGNANGNSNGNANTDPKQDPAATATQIADIARQALDKTARRVEAPPADAASGGTIQPDSAQAGSAQQFPDGSANLIAPAHQTTAAVAATGAAPTATETPTAVPIAGLAVEIAAHARAGRNRFEIRLDPPELGRINVRLDVDHDGKVTSRLVVDRQETLDILRRDAPALEHALHQAGLQTADNALQFSLRDQGGFGGQNPNPNYGSPADSARVIIPDRELPPVEATTAAYGRMASTGVGIDIRV
jgi:flagellar hook-length control protein FliK